MASYRLNREALADLDRLYEHGVLTFGLRQADAYFDGIVTRFQEIADQPELYPAIDHIRQGLPPQRLQITLDLLSHRP